jgi:hypothetical protein
VSPAERDRWRRFRRNWWIRLLLPVWVQHVWLIVITALVVSALVAFNDQQQRSTELGLAIQQQRADATREAPKQDCQRLVRQRVLAPPK